MMIRAALAANSTSSGASTALNLAIPFRVVGDVDCGEVGVGDRTGDEVLEFGGGGRREGQGPCSGL